MWFGEIQWDSVIYCDLLWIIVRLTVSPKSNQVVLGKISQSYVKSGGPGSLDSVRYGEIRRDTVRFSDILWNILRVNNILWHF